MTTISRRWSTKSRPSSGTRASTHYQTRISKETRLSRQQVSFAYGDFDGVSLKSLAFIHKYVTQLKWIKISLILLFFSNLSIPAQGWQGRVHRRVLAIRRRRSYPSPSAHPYNQGSLLQLQAKVTPIWRILFTTIPFLRFARVVTGDCTLTPDGSM